MAPLSSTWCPNITAVGWGQCYPFNNCQSLLRVDLSGLPKLESIPEKAFGGCRNLVSVVFGELSSIANLGPMAFEKCSALTSITLPNKLEVIEDIAFVECTSLERVVCNKTLETIGGGAFQTCPKLDFQLASSSISFGLNPFAACDLLIEIAAATGFPSNTVAPVGSHGAGANIGDGIVSYLID